MEKAYKFRIYPNKEQQLLLAKTFGCVRFIWNHMLAEKEKAYKEEKKNLGYAILSAELPKLKQEYHWLKEVDSIALQREIKNLSLAYDRFFKGIARHPKFKRKKDSRKSYTTGFSHNNIQVLGQHIKLPKLGLVRYRDKRHGIEGRILNATISQEPSGKYYVSVCCTDTCLEHSAVKTGKSVGIDLGLKEFGITSDGHKFQNLRFLKRQLKKLKRLQRALSRKTKDGSRWNKNRKSLAVVYEKIRHARLDYQRKLSTWLIQNYDVICLESLKVKNMIKNHKLAQAISDVAWGQFVQILTYKAEWCDKRIVKIDAYFPSSQTCNKCGHVNKNVKDLSVREWTCPVCGTHHDRDINAAKNILAEGLKLI